MPDRWIHVPAHMVHAAPEFACAAEAAVDASRLVEKDRVPRMVLRVHAQVQVSPQPKVDIVQIAEVANG